MLCVWCVKVYTRLCAAIHTHNKALQLLSTPAPTKHLVQTHNGLANEAPDMPTNKNTQSHRWHLATVHTHTYIHTLHTHTHTRQGLRLEGAGGVRPLDLFSYPPLIEVAVVLFLRSAHTLTQTHSLTHSHTNTLTHTDQSSLSQYNTRLCHTNHPWRWQASSCTRERENAHP